MNHLELFAGIGGFRRALDLLTKDKVMCVNTIGYSEIDPKAVMTYKANYNTANEIALGDIVTFTENIDNIKRLPHFDLLTGGFPCQSFSVMGEQSGFDDVERGQMFFKIIDILSICRPKYVLLENVKNLYTHNKGKTLKKIEDELKKLGYNVYYDIFNSVDFHLPQRRNRVIIFATLDFPVDDFCFSADKIKTFFDKRYKSCSILHFENVIDILAQQVEPKYFLSERIKPTILSDGSAGFKSRSDINQKIARTLTASMHKMHRACQDNYYSQDFIDSKGEYNPVQTMNKEELCRLDIRKITPEEAFLLQGFPEDFVKKARCANVGDNALYKQAGNAVSVNTIYAVLYYLVQNNIIKNK